MTRSLASRPRAGLRVEAFLIAAAVRVGLRCFSVARVARGLAAIPRRRAAFADPVHHCLSAAASGAAQAAHPTCLFRALVAFALLARRDRDAVFHLGASPGEDFSAHAWVTQDGESLDLPGTRKYVSLWQQPAREPHRADRAHLAPNRDGAGPLA